MVHVKVCGITRTEDALAAARLGASAVGFVFWPNSPRFIEPDRARAIVQELPPMVVPVGVFVDQPIAHVEEVARVVGLGLVQLHGQESAEYVTRMTHRVIKAFPMEASFDWQRVAGLPAHVTVLLDAYDPVRKGGTGRTVDWQAAREVAARRRVMLSGGLRAENVSEAIATVRPYGVDVSSGVETRPGVKDHRRLQEFLAAVDRARLGGSGALEEDQGGSGRVGAKG